MVLASLIWLNRRTGRSRRVQLPVDQVCDVVEWGLGGDVGCPVAFPLDPDKPFFGQPRLSVVAIGTKLAATVRQAVVLSRDAVIETSNVITLRLRLSCHPVIPHKQKLVTGIAWHEDTGALLST